MRIQHNIMAMNAYRNYNNNASALSKNLEKLSSGYKINRAGDDAAGLAISEKMRAQITGLNAAQKNVKDGISLVKTAEGAMQEVQDMLNRMDYLATQSANGTYDNEVDRANLQKEVDALKTEINRIADSANFNGIKLLDGSIEATSAGSKTVSGMDRILSSVIGKDEKANEVSGEKTILDRGAGAAAKGVFNVDLTNLVFTRKGTAAATVDFTLKVGDKEFATKATWAAGKSNASLVIAIASKIKGTQTVNGVQWTVTANGNGVLTFTQKNEPANDAETQTDFDVSFSVKNEAAASATKGYTVASSHLHGTQTTTVSRAAAGSNKANTTFKITADDIRDGTTITIGTKTVTIALGADSKNKTATNKVDLTMMEKDDIDLNKALAAISAQFTNVNYKDGVKKNNDSAGTIALQVGVSDGANGNEVGITVQRTTAIGVATDAVGVHFKTKEDLAKVFSMKVAVDENSGLKLQIGDTSDAFNQMSVSVKDMHTNAMGIAGVDISTQDGAAAAVQTIKNAINYVSSVRGDLGAVQNRLEHTANNLSVMAENIQDAESTIRDTDVAEEMMAYVKNNILVQSAQAMLAQANQVPQGVLQLLG